MPAFHPSILSQTIISAATRQNSYSLQCQPRSPSTSTGSISSCLTVAKTATHSTGPTTSTRPRLQATFINLINEYDSTNWRFDPQPSQESIDSQRLLMALKIGVLEHTLHQALLHRLWQIPIAYSTRFHESITCRVWLKEALFALDGEGYIKLTESVNDIEAKATNLEMRNKIRGTKTVARSSGSQT